jgi:hypothetical protein
MSLIARIKRETATEIGIGEEKEIQFNLYFRITLELTLLEQTGFHIW